MTKKTPAENEVILSGHAVSRGIAIGKVLCLYGKKRQFYHVKIDSSQISKEISRFKLGVKTAQKQLEQLIFDDSGGKHQAEIFTVHQTFLKDKSLLADIESTIVEQKVNAEWAIQVTVDSYLAKYKQLSIQHLREKFIDLEDVAERLISALGNPYGVDIKQDGNSIIVAKEIKPSTLVELSKNQPKALITEIGGWTSHTFILARELGIPAITGIKKVLRQVDSGNEVYVNGFNGRVLIQDFFEM